MNRRSFLVGAAAIAIAPAPSLVRTVGKSPFLAAPYGASDQLIDSWDDLVKLVGDEPEVHRLIATVLITIRHDLASAPYNIRRA